LMKQYKGGCSCGSVRFEVHDRPLWTIVCHCNACKKRTGSAFGLSVVFDAASVKEFVGATKTFIRIGESGKAVRYEFCPTCGTTLRWHVALLPNRQVFAGGAFDEVGQFGVVGEMYTGDALPWARLGCELSRPGAPDDDFRTAMIEKARPSR
jgi:hypothetical protein